MRPVVQEDAAWLTPLYAAEGGPGEGAERELTDALDHFTKHGFCHFAALSRASGEPVGVIELHFAGEGLVGIEADEVELGWVIAPEHRGCGLARDGATAVAEYAFDELGCDHVVAYIRSGNPASSRVAEKVGMRVRGPGRSKSDDPVEVWELRRP